MTDNDTQTDEARAAARRAARASSKTIEKTIWGRPVTQTAFKRAVAEAILSMNEQKGRVEDLIPILGDEWNPGEQRKVLAKTLANLATSGVLKRDPERRGLYSVSGRFSWAGVSVSDEIASAIKQAIRKRGGIARFSEIMDDFNLRAHGEDLREVRAKRDRRLSGRETPEDMVTTHIDVRDQTIYRQALRVMDTDPDIRQDYSFHRAGLYNLPQDEMNTMPLRGLFAAYQIKTTLMEFGREKRFLADRDEFFTRVGTVYNDARKMRGMSRLEFVRRKQVMAALLDLSRHPEVDRVLRRHFSDTTEAKINEMKEKGVPTAEIAAFRLDRVNSREGHQFAIDLLERFELGGEPLEEGLEPAGINIHSNAPVSFYVALANELGIDPVMASRGYLTLDIRGEKVRPQRNVASLERMMEVNDKRLLKLEQQRYYEEFGEHPEGETHFPDVDDPDDD